MLWPVFCEIVIRQFFFYHHFFLLDRYFIDINGYGIQDQVCLFLRTVCPGNVFFYISCVLVNNLGAGRGLGGWSNI